ncbi:hypothetical protein [Bradyrhizobium sp. SZCCHNS3002]|uniref:hypothetical protein n=1 Tax=unclassified Bradyrhizobium TaxID=2631580 RepID=UPI0028E1E7A6|nr:hypothetical protein [Bradyrhizobium sp. SZCCHNS3002]
MRKTMTLAAVLAGLGGLLGMSQAGRETAPTLVPVARADDGTLAAYAHLAALHARADSQLLSYEPARRDREGDDDDQDEPRR